jgi:hypothetical protein
MGRNVTVDPRIGAAGRLEPGLLRTEPSTHTPHAGGRGCTREPVQVLTYPALW